MKSMPGNFSSRMKPLLAIIVASILAVCGTLGVEARPSVAGYTTSAKAVANVGSNQWVVSGFSVVSTFAGVNASWTKAGDYNSYTVQWSTSSSFTSPVSATATGTTYRFTTLKTSTTYYARVRPNPSPTGTWSNTFSFLTPPVLSQN